MISFTIKTKHTNLWTGVGFSEDEKMVNNRTLFKFCIFPSFDMFISRVLYEILSLQSQTDAVLGWVDKSSGRAFVMDTWISGYNPPLLDPSQDIFNASGYIEDGETTLRFSRKRSTKDSRDLSFTDEQCLYLMFPVKGGIFNPVNKKIRKHDAVPIVSAEKICIKSCGIEGIHNFFFFFKLSKTKFYFVKF